MTARDLDRYWFLTWTTYGSWLPGDKRGFVGNVVDGSHVRVRRNIPGTPFEADSPCLERAARSLLKCPPVRLDAEQARTLLEQFRETANHRKWQIFAVGIMANHAHIVVGVPGDPDPARVLRDFKSYGSRALNRRHSQPISGRWWSDSGSKRKLAGHLAILAAVRYVVEQEYPLVVWTQPIPELGLPGGRVV